MRFSYYKISKDAHNFIRLSGLKVEGFSVLVETVRPLYEALESSKKKAGRLSHFPSLEDKLLCVLMYYRTYITHEFLGYLFNLHNSNISRVLRKMEALLAKKIIIKKDRSLTPEKILKILLDVSEQPTQRPEKKQKTSY